MQEPRTNLPEREPRLCQPREPPWGAQRPVSDVDVFVLALSSYDGAGHTRAVTHSGPSSPNDIDYLYSASGQLIARTAGNKTTYLYYFASSASLAEEARPDGTTRARFLNGPSGGHIAEQRLEDAAGDPMAPKWIWLLKDPDGNVATEIEDTGTGPEVSAQRAYDPYGSPDLGGSAISGDVSDLGFQSDLTDQDTGNLLLGPRIYDPRTDRFTTADFFVGASSDLALGTDPLTGNRYVFAAANPVAFYEDGHCPRPSVCGADTRAPSRTQNRQNDLAGQSVASWSWGAPTISPAETRYYEGEQVEPPAFLPFGSLPGVAPVGGFLKKHAWEVAGGAAAGVCIVASAGVCAGALGALFIAKTKSSYTEAQGINSKFLKDTGFNIFTTGTLALGGYGATLAARGLSAVGRYLLKTYIQFPSILCSTSPVCSSPGVPGE